MEKNVRDAAGLTDLFQQQRTDRYIQQLAAFQRVAEVFTELLPTIKDEPIRGQRLRVLSNSFLDVNNRSREESFQLILIALRSLRPARAKRRAQIEANGHELFIRVFVLPDRAAV